MLKWIVSSSILILIVVVLRAVLGKRIGLRLRYALWLLVLARLLVPVSFGSTALSVLNLSEPVSATSAVRAAEAIGSLRIPTQTFGSAYEQVVEDYEARGVDVSTLEGSDLEALDYEAYELMQGASIAELLKSAALFIWLAGAAAVGVAILCSNLRFYRRLCQDRHRLDVSDCPLLVYITNTVETPCIFGILHPKVYITQEIADNSIALRHAIAHETTHYRHGDHIWALLRCVCLALHWYNPLVWLAASLSRRDSELACDEGTIARLGEDERLAYGNTLIDLTCEKRSGELFRAATTMTGEKSTIRERVSLIARRPRTTALALCALLIISAFAVGCTFTGGEEDFTPDSVTMGQMLSSVLPEGMPITDPDTVAYLWELYQSLEFDGTADGMDSDNVWSISVSFTDSRSGESESFTLYSGGLCQLGDDLETWHVTKNGAEIYKEFEAELNARYTSDVERWTQEIDPSAFTAHGESFEDVGLDWAEQYARMYVDAVSSDSPLLCTESAVLGAELTAESLLASPKYLVFNMVFAFKPVDNDSFSQFRFNSAPSRDKKYLSDLGWLTDGFFAVLEPDGAGGWVCSGTGTGGYGGWGYLNYDMAADADFYMEMVCDGSYDGNGENVLCLLPFVDWGGLGPDGWNALYSLIDGCCLTDGQVYGPEETRMWSDAYPDDQAYRDAYVMLAALSSDGAYTEGLADVLRKQHDYDADSFELALSTLDSEQREIIESFIK